MRKDECANRPDKTALNSEITPHAGALTPRSINEKITRLQEPGRRGDERSRLNYIAGSKPTVPIRAAELKRGNASR